jgi:hypothetical protein
MSFVSPFDVLFLVKMHSYFDIEYVYKYKTLTHNFFSLF